MGEIMLFYFYYFTGESKRPKKEVSSVVKLLMDITTAWRTILEVKIGYPKLWRGSNVIRSRLKRHITIVI